MQVVNYYLILILRIAPNSIYHVKNSQWFASLVIGRYPIYISKIYESTEGSHLWRVVLHFRASS